MIVIDGDFENGCLDRAVRLGENWYHLELRPDTWYWFHCRIRGCKGRDLILQTTCRDILSPGYNEGSGRWKCGNTLVKPVVSYDRKIWEPVAFIEKDRSLPGTYRFRHTFIEDEAYVCFGHPYTYSDMQEWLKTVEAHPLVERGSIGQSRNGVDQPLLTITRSPDSRQMVVLIAREDADEAPGSFAAEGAVRLLLDEGDDMVKRFLDRFVVQFVPMVGVDGVIAGATHSAGYGYGGNRWHEEPSPDEIENVKRAARQWAGDGCQLALAGKLHAGMTLQPVHSIDMLTCDSELRRVMSETADEYWRPRERDLEIRPQGYFERFMLDDFGLRTTFATHVQGTSPENVRRCGVGMMRAIMTYLEQH